MNFKDRWATDEHGEQFLFTVEMQRRLNQAGLPIEPTYVKELTAVSRSYAPPPRRERYTSEVETPAYDPPSRDARDEKEFPVPTTIQIDPQSGKYIGRMKWFNAKKGYGFIVRGAGEEIFFHKSSSFADPEQMEDGQWVLYDVEETRKGPEATDVEPYTGDVDLLDWN